MEWRNAQLAELIDRILAEDIGTGDLTTEATVPPEQHSLARIVAKEPGVLAGGPLVERILGRLDPGVEVDLLVAEGGDVAPRQTVAEIRGRTRAILSGERVVLNLLQRLSGIATRTARWKELVAETGAALVDTRKTTPGLRMLEKYAVRVGGGRNHRFGLYDAVLIKENHIASCGGVAEALDRVREHVGHTVTIQIEVTDLAELETALDAGARHVLLDNMSPEELAEAVAVTAGRAELEASGGITAETLAEVARTGVDRISVGALTHSVPALDLSLQLARGAGR